MFKKKLLLATFFIGVGIFPVQAVAEEDFMRLSDVSLLGTHDTMASKVDSMWIGSLEKYVITQNETIENQLNMGVRYFDFRLCHIDSRLTFHHDKFYLGSQIEDALGPIKSFLQSNPNEYILIRMKQENSSVAASTFANRVASKLEASLPKSMIYTKESGVDNPKIGAIKGKVVVMAQGFESKYGLKYKASNQVIQDDYYLPNPSDVTRKKQLVETNLKGAMSRSGKIYLNHLSGTGIDGIGGVVGNNYSPKEIANLVNPIIPNLLNNTYKDDFNYGVIIADFATKELGDVIDRDNHRFSIESWDAVNKKLTIKTDGNLLLAIERAKINPEYANVKTLVLKGASSLSKSSGQMSAFPEVERIELEGVVKVDSSAFSEFKKLKTLIAPNLTTITGNGFKSLTSLEELELGATTKNEWNALNEAFYLSGVKKISLPKASIIEENAFQKFTNLTTVNAENVMTIEDEAFANLPQLESFIGNKVSIIGNKSFYNTPKLKDIQLESVTSIGNEAFKDAKKIEEVNLPNTKTIGSEAFKGATNIKSIVIPQIVTIKPNTFEGAIYLKSIQAEALEVIEKQAFKNVRTLKNISLPSLKRVEEEAFYNAQELETLEAEKLFIIGDRGFQNAYNLKTIKIPAIREVGIETFSGSNKLEIVETSLSNIGYLLEMAANNKQTLFIAKEPIQNFEHQKKSGEGLILSSGIKTMNETSDNLLSKVEVKWMRDGKEVGNTNKLVWEKLKTVDKGMYMDFSSVKLSTGESYATYRGAHNIDVKLVNGGPIKVTYQDQDNTLLEYLTIEGELGTEYKTEKREFSGYKFDEVTGESNGTFSSKEVDVRYLYHQLDSEITPYSQFKLGYWREKGFILEGQAGIEESPMGQSREIEKRVELVDKEGTVVVSNVAQNTNWYKPGRYDGYQGGLSMAELGTLQSGDYRVQVRLIIDGKEYEIPVVEESSRSWTGEYQDSISGLETMTAQKNKISFSSMNDEMILTAEGEDVGMNILASYLNPAGNHIIDGWLAADIDFSETHQKELVITDNKNKEVYRKATPTWDLKKVFGLNLKSEWNLSGFQASIPKKYLGTSYLCHIEVKNSEGKVIVSMEL